MQAHQLKYPDFQVAHVSPALGTLGARYVIDHQRAAYFPARFIEEKEAFRLGTFLVESE